MPVKELTFEEYEAMRCIEKLIFMKRQEIIKLEDRLRPYYDILEIQPYYYIPEKTDD